MASGDDLETLHDEFARWAEQRKIVSEEDAGWEDSDDDGIRLLQRIGEFLWCGEGARPTEPPAAATDQPHINQTGVCRICRQPIRYYLSGWWTVASDGGPSSYFCGGANFHEPKRKD